MSEHTNGWSRAEMHVLAELKRLSTVVESVDQQLTDLRVDVARKGALWGAVSGAVVAVVGALFR